MQDRAGEAETPASALPAVGDKKDEAAAVPVGSVPGRLGLPGGELVQASVRHRRKSPVPPSSPLSGPICVKMC